MYRKIASFTFRSICVFAILTSSLAAGLFATARPARAAGWVVNTLTDATNGNCTTTCTLRDAMSLAASGDTITFSVSGTITLGSTLPNVTTTLTIDGTGQTVTISGNNAVGMFTVDYPNGSNGNLTLNALTVANGKSANGGGAIDNGGMLTITSSTFSNNSASGQSGPINGSDGVGGGLSFGGGTATITGSTFSGNSAIAGPQNNSGSQGGAIANGGTLTITNSTFSNNSAQQIVSSGGGVYNAGTLTIANSTFYGNSANDYAGGLYASGSTTVTNSTFSHNLSSFLGGGIYTGANFSLGSSIVADNGDDVYGSVHSLGSNVIGNGSNATGFIGSDQVGTSGAPLNAKLSTLGSYGGPTQTVMLQAGDSFIGGNPAIGKGNCNLTTPPLTTDQRGVSRKAVCDAGAFEDFDFSPAPLPDAFQGIAYSQAITASGGTNPYTFSNTSGLPGGIGLSSGGLLQGTTSQLGTFANFKFTVTDGNGDVVEWRTSLTVIVAPTNTPTNTPTPTATDTPTDTPTNTPTFTPSDTPTNTSTPINTLTFTPTATSTNTPTFTPTATSTPFPLRIDSIGVFRTGTFYLRLHNSTGYADISVAFTGSGKPYPVVGDWTGGGFDTVGVFNQNNGQFSLRNSNTPGTPDEQFVFGNPNDIPLSGLWTSGFTHFGVGVFRPSNGLIYLKNNLTTGIADYTMVLGIPGDVGLAGDWNGDGLDSPGVYRTSTQRFYLADQVCNCSPTANYTLQYGVSGNSPIIGDWVGQGHDGVGLFRQSNGFTYLRNSLTTGYADITFTYGIAGDIPVAGHWQLTYPPRLNPGSVLVPPTLAPLPTAKASQGGLGD